MSTIPCDFCPHPVDRAQMEEIEISHYVPDSSGDDLAYARTYFFGHPDCVRKFYRALVDHKLDLFKHIPTSAPAQGPRTKRVCKQDGTGRSRAVLPWRNWIARRPPKAKVARSSRAGSTIFPTADEAMTGVRTRDDARRTRRPPPATFRSARSWRRRRDRSKRATRRSATRSDRACGDARDPRQRRRALGRWRIGGTLYVTKEPCRDVRGCDRRGADRTRRVRLLRSEGRCGRKRRRYLRVGRCESPRRVTSGVLAEETAAQLRAFFAARRRVADD